MPNTFLNLGPNFDFVGTEDCDSKPGLFSSQFLYFISYENDLSTGIRIPSYSSSSNLNDGIWTGKFRINLIARSYFFVQNLILDFKLKFGLCCFKEVFHFTSSLTASNESLYPKSHV